MKKIRIVSLSILYIALSLIFPSTSSAHPGRTDSSGGHHDYQNRSGLGSYHYHHGMGPHLHPGGVCPYSEENTYTPPAPSPSITIEDYPTTLYVGERSGFEYSVHDAANDETSVTSSDTNVVKVNSNNTLTAVNSGTAQITIEVSGITKSFTVNVVSIPVEEIIITNGIDRIQLGRYYQFESDVLPQNATNKEVTWSSDNTGVLEIDDSGKIKTKSSGMVTVTATAENGMESKLSIEVFEVVPKSIKCKNSINLIVGDKKNYKISILPKKSNNKEFKVSCEDEDILKYSESSVLALSEGETILHIETWNSIKKDIPVKVDIIPVERVEIEDDTNYIFSNIIDKSSKILITTNIFPNNATYQDITWFSSDPNIVNVNDGEFVTHGTGKVFLTCFVHGYVKGSIEITVVNQSLIIIISVSCVVGIAAIISFFIRKRHKKDSRGCREIDSSQ